MATKSKSAIIDELNRKIAELESQNAALASTAPKVKESKIDKLPACARRIMATGAGIAIAEIMSSSDVDGSIAKMLCADGVGYRVVLSYDAILGYIVELNRNNESCSYSTGTLSSSDKRSNIRVEGNYPRLMVAIANGEHSESLGTAHGLLAAVSVADGNPSSSLHNKALDAAAATSAWLRERGVNIGESYFDPYIPW